MLKKSNQNTRLIDKNIDSKYLLGQKFNNQTKRQIYYSLKKSQSQKDFIRLYIQNPNTFIIITLLPIKLIFIIKSYLSHLISFIQKMYV